MDMKKIGKTIITSVAATAFYASTLLTPMQADSHPMNEKHNKPHYHASIKDGTQSPRRQGKKKIKVDDKTTHVINLEGRIQCENYTVKPKDTFGRIADNFGYDNWRDLRNINREIGTVGVREDPKDLDKGAILRVLYFKDKNGHKHSGDLPVSLAADVYNGFCQEKPDLLARKRAELKLDKCNLPESKTPVAPAQKTPAQAPAEAPKAPAEKPRVPKTPTPQVPAKETIYVPAPKAAEVPKAEKQRRYNIAIDALFMPEGQELKLSKIYNVNNSGLSVNPYIGVFNGLENTEYKSQHSDSTVLLPDNITSEQLIDDINTTIKNKPRYEAGLGLEQKLGKSNFSITATGGIVFGEENKLVDEVKTANYLRNDNVIATGTISNQKNFKEKTREVIYSVGAKYNLTQDWALTAGAVKSKKINQGYFGIQKKF